MTITQVPLTVLNSLMHVAVKGGVTLASLPPDSKVMGVVVRPEFSYVVDNVWIHINPTKPADKYDLFLIIGSKDDDDEYVTNQKRGKAYMKLLDEYGDTEIRQWNEERLETEMSKLLSV